ncbi:MAG TPA: hypothetical protein VGF54_19445 [Streptosporangiaceae bacterium]|jgi:hypothetical protein
MAYLDQAYQFPGDTTPTLAGTWVPELNWRDWEERGASLTLREAWTSLDGLTAEQVADFDRMPEYLQKQHLADLGRDMASAQRDGLFYFNALERLKNEPNDTVADEVIDHMKDLGFTGAGLPEEVGGPPPGRSPRPFRKVMEWLIRQIAKVGKFLLNAVAFITTRLYDLGLSAVSLQIGWPPAVSFEFPPGLFRDNPRWSKAKELVENYFTELEQKVLA